MPRFEFTILGGGIAGLAIAEIFARSGFSVCLIEKNDQLCTETSGMHHEWFHFGSLYSIFPSNQFLRTVVGGIDDLLLYYRDFQGMNLRVDGKGKLLTIKKKHAWIRQDNLKYIITSTQNSDFKLTNTKMRELPYKIFMKYSWNKAIKQFIARHNRFYKYDWRKGCASHYIPKAGWLDYSKDHISPFKNDEVNLDPLTHSSMESYDRPMNAYYIISDLVRSYLSYGGEIITGKAVAGYEKTSKGTRVIINDFTHSIITDHLILATGGGTEYITKGKIKINSVASPLLVVYPKVCSSNIVRLTPFINKTINHLKHRISGNDYSLIGGGYFADANNKIAIEESGRKLKTMAKNTFPQIKDAEISEVYYGIKNEIISTKAKRNYLYNIIELEKNILTVVPGKFSLAFSLAVNTYKKILGHYPNTYISYDPKIPVDKYIGQMRHKTMVKKVLNAEGK